MITLNSDKELVRIESWEEILSRPDYVANIDPQSIQLEAIIGSYVLSDPVPCGLSSCHQPHNKGYLVSTTNKSVTNIGNVCGKNHFLVDFETLRNQFDRDVRIKEQRETLRNFVCKIPHYKNRLLELKSGEGGANWVYKFVRKLKTPCWDVPEKIHRELRRMIRDGTNEVTIQRKVTEAEVETLQVMGGAPSKQFRYINERIGVIDGFPAVYEENDLRKLLVEDIQAGIDRISQLNVREVSQHQLRLESQWVGEIDAKFERAANAIHYGRRLLTKSNLSQLIGFLTDEKDRKLFREFLAAIPENEGK